MKQTEQASLEAVEGLRKLRSKNLVPVLTTILLLMCGALLLFAFPKVAYAADGDINVVTDPQLQACINATKFVTPRPATTPISDVEMASLTGNINAAAYPGITSFEGLQYATQIGSLTFKEVTVSDMTPIAGMTNLNAINFQSHTTPNGVLDLTPLAPIASNFNTLNLNYSTWDVPTTQIIGLDAFVNLLTFSASYNALSDLPGLSSLTHLNTLYLSSNNFGNDIIAQIPNKSYAVLSLLWNHISDFTGIPPATSRWLAGQIVAGTDVLLASADQNTFTADPLERPVAFVGGSVLNNTMGGIADVGPITFDATDFYTATELFDYYGLDLSMIPAAYQDFAYYEWYLDPSTPTDIDDAGYSYSFYPTVVVDMNDNSGLGLYTATASDLAFVSFNYSVSDPSAPSFLPTSFALDSGSLPAGITLDPVSGHLVGTTSELGTFGFTVSATDADGLVVLGDFKLTVNEPPVIPPTTPPTGDFLGFGGTALMGALLAGGLILLMIKLKRSHQ